VWWAAASRSTQCAAVANATRCPAWQARMAARYPGHGEVVTLAYLACQRANLLDWVQAVADAVAKGWSPEETVERVTVAERYPVDIGQGYMMKHIQTLNAGSLWDKSPTPGRPDGRGRGASHQS
jgi:hypothetical protein